MNPISEKPKLSILVTAYNIAAYLPQCLDSILSQQVNFTYEVLVAEDCSTDATRTIVKKYEQNHSDVIKGFYNTTNMGYSGNLCYLAEQATGELLIQIDGDDFLTDVSKLQLQVNALEANPTCAICIHNFVNVNAQGENPTPNIYLFTGNCILPKDYIYNQVLGPGNLVMMKRSALPAVLPNWLSGCANQVDYAMHCLAYSEGEIFYIDQLLTAYRKHDGSITSLSKKKDFLEMLIYCPKHLAEFYRAKGLKRGAVFFQSLLPNRYITLGYFYLSQGKVLSFLFYFFKGFLQQPNFNLKSHKDMLYTAAPELVQKIKNIF